MDPVFPIQTKKNGSDTRKNLRELDKMEGVCLTDACCELKWKAGDEEGVTNDVTNVTVVLILVVVVFVIPVVVMIALLRDRSYAGYSDDDI